MILPSDKYSLLLLADWLEEYGSSYDIVKANAIRNNKYDLNYIDNCKISKYENGNGGGYCVLREFGLEDSTGYGYGNGIGWGDGIADGSGGGHGRGKGWGSDTK